MTIVRPKRHTYFLTVEEHTSMNSKDMLNLLHTWLECYGHTTDGFDLCSVADSSDKAKKIERK